MTDTDQAGTSGGRDAALAMDSPGATGRGIFSDKGVPSAGRPGGRRLVKQACCCQGRQGEEGEMDQDDGTGHGGHRGEGEESEETTRRAAPRSPSFFCSSSPPIAKTRPQP